MTEAQARARLELLIAISDEPLISASEFEDIFQQCKTIDINGLAPIDSGYIASWDLNRGAALGWTRKAGKAAGNYTFASGGRSFARSQVFDHCIKMAQMYAKKTKFQAVATMASGPSAPSTLPVGNAWANPPIRRAGYRYLDATDMSEDEWYGRLVVPY